MQSISLNWPPRLSLTASKWEAIHDGAGNETRLHWLEGNLQQRPHRKLALPLYMFRLVNASYRDKAYLESLVAEAEEAVEGKRVSREDELDETEKKL